MAGYMPLTEPEEFDNWHDAHAYLVDTLESWWDNDVDSYADTDSIFLTAHTEMHAATEGEECFYVLNYPSWDMVMWLTIGDE